MLFQRLLKRLGCLAPKQEFSGASRRWIPMSGLAWSLYKCAAWWGLSVVLLQRKDQLELFVNKREFHSCSGFLFCRDMIHAVERNIKNILSFLSKILVAGSISIHALIRMWGLFCVLDYYRTILILVISSVIKSISLHAFEGWNTTQSWTCYLSSFFDHKTNHKRWNLDKYMQPGHTVLY